VRAIRRFLTLPRADRSLLLRALGWVVVSRVALWTLPFARVRALAERMARPRSRIYR
jgi:hypothetical protein